MPFSPKTIEEKPYNMCLDCIHIGKNCDGPNFLAMDIDRWCEWCHLRKEYLGWTNARVAEISGLSKISVDRVMSGNVKDLRITTMQSITKALVNGSWGQYPCSMAAQEQECVYVDNPALVERCEQLQQKVDFLRDQIKFKEDQMHKKDKLLEERYEFLKRKDRIIVLLSVLLGIAVLTIIIALIIDKTDPSLGFIWRVAASMSTQ